MKISCELRPDIYFFTKYFQIICSFKLFSKKIGLFNGYIHIEKVLKQTNIDHSQIFSMLNRSTYGSINN